LRNTPRGNADLGRSAGNNANPNGFAGRNADPSLPNTLCGAGKRRQ